MEGTTIEADFRLNMDLKIVGRKLFEYQPLNRTILDSYNFALREEIPRVFQLNTPRFTLDDGTQVRVVHENFQWLYPHTGNIDTKGDIYWPYMARLNKDNYTIPFYVDKIFQERKGNEWVTVQTLSTRHIVDYPCMLSSMACNLSRINRILPPDFKGVRDPNNLATMIYEDVYECPNDPMCYFIYNGLEKVLITQEKLATNLSFTRIRKKTDQLVCEVRSLAPDANIYLNYVYLLAHKDTLKQTIHIYIPIIKNQRNSINVVNLLRLLLFINGDVDEANSFEEAERMFREYMDRNTNASQLKQYNDFTVEEARRLIEFEDFLAQMAEDFGLTGAREDEELRRLLEEYDPTKTEENQDEPFYVFIEKNYAKVTKAKLKQRRTITTIINAYKRSLGEDEVRRGDYKPNAQELTNLRRDLNRNFLPHIVSSDLDSKLTVLVDMILRVIKVHLNISAPSDIDHYGVKRLETPGYLLLGLFARIYSKVIRDTQNDLQAARISGEWWKIYEATWNKYRGEIQKTIRSSMVESKWGVKNSKQKTGVSQQLSVLSLPARWSMVRRVGSSIGKKSVVTKAREVNPTQFAVVCPNETPEAAQCGLVKALSVSAYITVEMPSEDVEEILNIEAFYDAVATRGLADDTYQEYLQNPEYYLRYDPSEVDANATPFYINGAFLGYVNGPVVRNLLVAARRRGRIHRHTSITLGVEKDRLENKSFLRVFTTMGRGVRPLFIVGTDGDLEYIRYRGQSNTFTFESLLQNGVVEYVDVMEAEFLNIAIGYDELRANPGRFTHMEIDPSFIFGISANLMNFPQFNPAPRVSLTAHMLRQFVGVTLTSYQHRPDTGLKVLRYPQKQLISTDIYKEIGLEEQPGQQIITLAVLPEESNIEDAIIVNKASLERGLFNSDGYEIYTVETQEGQRIESKREELVQGVVPERRPLKVTSYKSVYPEACEEDIPPELRGLLPRGYLQPPCQYRPVTTIREASENYPVQKGDVLAAKSFINERGERQESTVIYGEERGVVDRIFRKQTPSSVSNVVRIRIRTENIPELGDKLMAPYSQKGVIGAVWPQEDVPFDPYTGVTPDILVSPHAFPSRMTIGMILEILVGKAVSCSNLQFKDHVIPGDILVEPILPVEGLRYSELSEKEKQVFRLLFNRYFVQPLRAGEDFVIPATVEEREDIRLLKQATREGKRYSDIKPMQRVQFKNLFPKLHQEGLDIAKERIREGQQDILDFVLPQALLAQPDVLVRQVDIGRKVWSIPATERRPRVSHLPPLQQKAYTILYDEISDYDPRQVADVIRKKGIRDLYNEHQRGLERRTIQACDTTAFREPDMCAVQDLLKDYGYRPQGEAALVSGQYGTMYQAAIYTGVCTYNALKHMVKDKMQARDTGKIQLINRQAVHGRAKGGGIRMGCNQPEWEIKLLLVFVTEGYTFKFREHPNQIIFRFLTFEMEEREWRKVHLDYYANSHQISNDGQVYSNISKLILKQHERNGYKAVGLCFKNKRKTCYIHDLVASAFLGRKEGHVVNHKDGNKQNNHVQNLEWITYKENTRHAIKSGLVGKTSKAVAQYDLLCNLIATYSSATEAATAIGEPQQQKHIPSVCRGKRLTCAGYVWKYVEEKHNARNDLVDEEEKREVEGYPRYLVTPSGKVLGLWKKQYLIPKLQDSGYLQVKLCNEQGKDDWNIHRLIAQAFIPNPENKPFVNHKNGIKSDNRVENLEWVTASENMIHAANVLGKRKVIGTSSAREPSVLNQ